MLQPGANNPTQMDCRNEVIASFDRKVLAIAVPAITAIAGQGKHGSDDSQFERAKLMIPWR
jgi:hypothetical protein